MRARAGVQDGDLRMQDVNCERAPSESPLGLLEQHPFFRVPAAGP